jgi:hypothetical protein
MAAPIASASGQGSFIAGSGGDPQFYADDGGGDGGDEGYAGRGRGAPDGILAASGNALLPGSFLLAASGAPLTGGLPGQLLSLDVARSGSPLTGGGVGVTAQLLPGAVGAGQSVAALDANVGANPAAALAVAGQPLVSMAIGEVNLLGGAANSTAPVGVTATGALPSNGTPLGGAVILSTSLIPADTPNPGLLPGSGALT